MLHTKEVTTNLSYPAIPAALTVLQGDSCRALKVRFFSGEMPWEIPENSDVFIQYTCADGSGGVFDTLPDGTVAAQVEGNAVTLRIPAEMCAVPGKTMAQVTIFSQGEQISAFPVEVRVLAQVGLRSGKGNYANLQKWLLAYVTEEPFVSAVVAALPNGDEVSY